MSARSKRAARLVSLAEAQVNAARGRLADARRAVAVAMAARDGAEGVWAVAAQAFGGNVRTVGDLEQTAGHLRTLRHVADMRAADVARAEQEQQARTRALFETMAEHRKLELWQKRLSEAEAAESARVERILADEQTARAAGRHA